jgi:hypothetical protein
MLTFVYCRVSFLQSPLLKQIVGDTVANLLKSVLGASSDKHHKRSNTASVQSLQVTYTGTFLSMNADTIFGVFFMSFLLGKPFPLVYCVVNIM